MKNFLAFIFFVLLTFPLLAGTVIKGVIVDGDTHSPIQFSDIALFKQGSKKLATGVTSDSLGRFTLPAVDAGSYTLRVTYIGYHTLNKPIVARGDTLRMDTIRLTSNSKQLGEVEVIGQTPQVRFELDKKVFSVDQNISAAGGSATDILKNIPSVDVDTQGNISLRNNPNVEVWIDGKASGLTSDNRAQILEQMPAESIESVEIMTNPSAKYNPEGSAGIINLVMKKTRKAGYYGSVSAGLFYPVGGKIGQSLGASLNYNSSKVSAYINMGYRALTFQGGGYNNRLNTLGTQTTLLNQNSSALTSFQGLFTRAGVDYHLDEKNTVGISGFGLAGSGHQNNNIDYLLSDQSTIPEIILRKYSRDNTSTGSRPSLHVNLDYEHDFDKKGSNLLAYLSYSSHVRGFDSRYLQRDSLGLMESDLQQHTSNNSKGGEFKLDYTNKITEDSKLEAGLQSDITNTVTTSSGFDNAKSIDLPAYSDNFNYDEQIHAAYVTYGTKIDKLSFQGGLRGEFEWKRSTNTTSSGVQLIPAKTYYELFPSAYITYNLTGNDEFQLNYSRRVNRPRGQQINPYRNYSDSTRITYGNPNLDPEFTSSVEMNYIKTIGDQTLSASVYYRYTNNVIENVQFLNAGTLESTYLNISNSQNTGVELISKNSFLRIFNVTTSVDLYYSKLDSATYVNPYNPLIRTTIPGQNNFSWTGSILANFILSKTFSGQVTARYSSPQIIAQGTSSDKYSIDFGLRKTFMDRKLSVNLNVRDLLNSNKNRSNTSGIGFTQSSESFFHTRMINLSVSYSFGNSKPKRQERIKQENQEPDIEDMSQ